MFAYGPADATAIPKPSRDLVEQWSDWVTATIDDQQQWSDVGLAEVEQRRLAGDHLLQTPDHNATTATINNTTVSPPSLSSLQVTLYIQHSEISERVS